jgi:hypothetical protein
MRSSVLVKLPAKKYKLFCPSTHLWIHAIQQSIAPQSANDYLSAVGGSAGTGAGWKVDVGITNRGLDDIGDISSIEYCITNNSSNQHQNDIASKSSSSVTTSPTFTYHAQNKIIHNARGVKYGDEILKVHWDGHLITRADELYHTVWDTVSDTTSVRAPLDGILCDINEIKGHPNDDYDMDSQTPLFTLWTDHDCIQQSLSRMMVEEEYNDYVTNHLDKGRFFDPEDQM